MQASLGSRSALRAPAARPSRAAARPVVVRAAAAAAEVPGASCIAQIGRRRAAASRRAVAAWHCAMQSHSGALGPPGAPGACPTTDTRPWASLADMNKRNIMNLVLLGGIGLPVAGLAGAGQFGAGSTQTQLQHVMRALAGAGAAPGPELAAAGAWRCSGISRLGGPTSGRSGLAFCEGRGAGGCSHNSRPAAVCRQRR